MARGGGPFGRAGHRGDGQARVAFPGDDEGAVRATSSPSWGRRAQQDGGGQPAGGAQLRPDVPADARAAAALLAAPRGGLGGATSSSRSRTCRLDPGADRERQPDEGGGEQLKEQLKPLVWFEKYRRDDAGGAQGGEATESDPLLAGLPTAKAKKKAFDFAAIKGMLPKEMFGEGGEAAAAAGGKKGKGKGKANPIVEHRKRMGFVVVADTSTFRVARLRVRRDRQDLRAAVDISDNIECPVSLVIVGNKADKRGARDCAPEAEMKELRPRPLREPRLALSRSTTSSTSSAPRRPTSGSSGSSSSRSAACARSPSARGSRRRAAASPASSASSRRGCASTCPSSSRSRCSGAALEGGAPLPLAVPGALAPPRRRRPAAVAVEAGEEGVEDPRHLPLDLRVVPARDPAVPQDDRRGRAVGDRGGGRARPRRRASART